MLEIQELVVRKSGRTLLEIADLAVAGGCLMALVGPNGAGKTTLLSALVNPKPRGRIRLYDKPLERWKTRDLAQVRGFLPQQFQLAAAFSVRDVVELGRSPHLTPRALNQAVARECLEHVGLGHAASRSYLTLSGGEAQRVHLARVLAQIGPRPDLWGAYPPLLLLDEPTASLDLGQRTAVLKIAKRIAKAGGIVIAVLHDLNIAARYADEICLLSQGRIYAHGSVGATLTADNLRAVYQANLEVVPHPAQAGLLVLEQD
ncbi:heme ABC transporter ATP-binding protein [Alkalilimnicola ehrlichii]|uniref:Heme ABC transporter ATP-binding protein n=1 Tax=Alkalilimnicola ehrlichii TaxID=351052 RepID=A0A3E0WNS9_9GAMM|nr:heme ABC transporter ATP-binding protein [Alkalilimnicola ehrlichii]RFA27977.1 heme ABC transporter ATP-binding protein [Alkalilimnicola ehrlichii]RFA34624.1 heme ABC transporter ATP-binding protein [Alkalilimnicola ehrlichii]